MLTDILKRWRGKKNVKVKEEKPDNPERLTFKPCLCFLASWQHMVMIKRRGGTMDKFLQMHIATIIKPQHYFLDPFQLKTINISLRSKVLELVGIQHSASYLGLDDSTKLR